MKGIIADTYPQYQCCPDAQTFGKNSQAIKLSETSPPHVQYLEYSALTTQLSKRYEAKSLESMEHECIYG